MQYKVEYTIFRNHDLASEYCREFLDGSWGHAVDTYSHQNRDTDYMVIFDDESSANKPYYFEGNLKVMSRDDLVILWYKHFDGYPGADVLTKDELIEELLTFTRRQYYAEHYEQFRPCDITNFDFVATGCNQGEIIKVRNADNNPNITAEYISQLFYDAPIHAEASIYKRVDSDSAWKLVDEIYLGEYTDVYKPSYDEVYQDLRAEKSLLAHLVAYDMPVDIFENV